MKKKYQAPILDVVLKYDSVLTASIDEGQITDDFATVGDGFF